MNVSGEGNITSESFHWSVNPVSKYPANYGQFKTYKNLTANPAEGYIFKGWVVKTCEEVPYEENPLPIDIVIDAQHGADVTAFFIKEESNPIELVEIEDPEPIEILQPNENTTNTEDPKPWEINPDEWEQIETPMGTVWRKKEVVENIEQPVIVDETTTTEEVVETSNTEDKTEEKKEEKDSDCFINILIR